MNINTKSLHSLNTDIQHSNRPCSVQCSEQLNQARSLDQQGIFAHQSEDIENFIKEGKSYPSQVSSSISPQIQRLLNHHFDVHNPSVTIEESTKFLLPWEIACCMIEKNNRPLIYTRPRRWFFRNIPQDAVIAHELIHAFRARLQSTIYEEYAAFDATHLLFPHGVSSLRTWLGPMFTNPWEAIVLCIMLFAINLLPWFVSSLANSSLLLLLTTATLAYPCIRCAFRWNQWNRAKRTLLKHFPEHAWKILIRLSDGEIKELSLIQKSQENEFFNHKTKTSWRWAIFTKPERPLKPNPR